MKGITICISGFLLVLAIVSSVKADITLNEPLLITAPAVKVQLASYTVRRSSIRALVNYLDADGAVVKQETVEITGGELDALKADAAALGRDIKTKLKALKGLVGTVN